MQAQARVISEVGQGSASIHPSGFSIALMASIGVHLVLVANVPRPQPKSVARNPVIITVAQARSLMPEKKPEADDSPAAAPAAAEPILAPKKAKRTKKKDPRKAVSKVKMEEKPAAIEKPMAPKQETDSQKSEAPIAQSSDASESIMATKKTDRKQNAANAQGGMGTGTKGALSKKVATGGLSPSQKRKILARYFAKVRKRVASNRSYPYAARRIRLEGIVRVRFQISHKGRVSKLRFLSPKPHRLLRYASIKAIRASEPFPVPPKQLGKGVDVEIPIVFKLKN